MTEREKMELGLLYDPGDEDITAEQILCLDILYEYNNTRPTEPERRQELLKKMFGSIGENCYIEIPFHANFGGKHVFMGDWVYCNSDTTLVDDGNIYIGNRVMFGPDVSVVTAAHPINAELRSRNLQYNRDVHIGDNVWIGAGAIILPGVSIGENSVIGAGSVVTKDIPANVVAYGNPCRVAREVGERDEIYLYGDVKINRDDL